MTLDQRFTMITLKCDTVNLLKKKPTKKMIYTDNGTNLVGTNNLMEKLDWVKIASSKDIQPSNTILVTQLIRQILSQSVLKYQE